MTAHRSPATEAAAQQPAYEVNYDEAKVPHHTLPALLTDASGRPVTAAAEWRQRRQQILELFRTHVYGHCPGKPEQVRYEVLSETSDALDGQAICREVRLHFQQADRQAHADLLIHLPSDAGGPVPMFLGLNFWGNHATHSNPRIRLSTRWTRQSAKAQGVIDNRPTDAARGTNANSWPYEQVLSQGFGVATLYYSDLLPDDPVGRYQEGVHRLFTGEDQSEPGSDQWRAIGAWAWGLSRALDYLETVPEVDAKRVAVLGHSRLGKTALWAGAQDERFAAVISNHSGCGGAAISRRRFGETLRIINTAFPHWFCANFRQYNDREDDLPVDQHMLVALVAPRPVLVCSAVDDRWADPRGEFLSVFHASEVYRLLGCEGVQSDQMPLPGQLLDTVAGYHIRQGGHGIGPADWDVFVRFVRKHLGS